jgi:hypothetical protein
VAYAVVVFASLLAWGLVARKARWGGLKEARGGRCAALSCRSFAFCAFRLSRLQPPKKQNPLSENLRLAGWRPPAAGFTLLVSNYSREKNEPLGGQLLLTNTLKWR